MSMTPAAPLTTEERSWATASHLSALVAIVGPAPRPHRSKLPLIIYLVKHKESEFVAEHARASLNYQITITIAAIIAAIVEIQSSSLIAMIAVSRGSRRPHASGDAASARRRHWSSSCYGSWHLRSHRRRSSSSRSSSSLWARWRPARANRTPTRSRSSSSAEGVAGRGRYQGQMQRIKPLESLLAEDGQDDPTVSAIVEPHALKRSLGPISLTAMGIGAIIGTGIFVLTGVASGDPIYRPVDHDLIRRRRLRQRACSSLLRRSL